ncbi:MAG: cupredoxin domain-containing protein [Candidatus Brennerbacteria bacterium]|nr:cupredoxin domain-containing protein [Candidatus Brennerbacteria bacterium]
MTRKQLIILAALGGFIALVAIIGAFSGRDAGPEGAGPAGSAEEETEGSGAVSLETSAYTSEVPENAVETPPAIEAPAAPGREETLGIFEMTVSRNGFAPSTLTVKLGNLVQIRLTAEDGDYDFSMPWSGLYQKVVKGETKQVSFQTTAAGTYRFECRDSCPAGAKIMGQLIVLP